MTWRRRSILLPRYLSRCWAGWCEDVSVCHFFFQKGVEVLERTTVRCLFSRNTVPGGVFFHRISQNSIGGLKVDTRAGFVLPTPILIVMFGSML